jgi:polyvinyl alcohol dehydrogenase (cytochrome)
VPTTATNRALFVCLAAFAVHSSFLSAQIVQWPVAGQTAANLRSQPAEYFLSSDNVASLIPKWTFITQGDVSATPTVGTSAIFVPDWDGNLFAIDLATGTQLWSHHVSDYNGYANAVTRVSPALYNNALIVGDSQSTGGTHNGAHVISIDQQTGAMLWITQVDPHPAAIITGSPVVVGNVIYQPISSAEEALALDQSYACCTFRGSVVALNADTGKSLWQTFVVPDNKGQAGGYSGAPMWQPPAIDVSRNLLYIGTGNNYSVPQSVESCRLKDPNDNNCAVPQDHFDSALALDLTTGAIRWARRLSGYDVWTAACKTSSALSSCPNPAGLDYDLSGSGPNLLPHMVGFSQKNGLYIALDPDTGSTLWSRFLGPAGPLGGIQWGTASDGTNIYIAEANSLRKPVTLLSGQQVTSGFWSAVNASTGQVLWQTPDPNPATMDEGAVSVANGILYVGSFDPAGHMYALSAATGAILSGFASGGSLIDGPSIANSNVFLGSGYHRVYRGTANNKVYDLTPAPAVTVNAPINGAQVTSPVQFTASAASPHCPNGVASLRIYTAPGQIGYTVDASSLNVALALSPGTYNTVVQSWDNCGNVGKTFVTITVSGGAH